MLLRVCRLTVVSLLVCVWFSACASSQDSTARDGRQRVVTQATGNSTALTTARALRNTGSTFLEKAYAAKREIDREVNFRKAESALDQALDSYSRARMASEGLYGPTIELEVDEVMEYLRQLQRDRKSPS